ncbi:hypothetical protein Nepgr_024954 [Nepenthes gracilis]|uniref:Uncharacterized protein n=1 Tax=Nepenthes gracilis TaxID=150966 RepID=A0AAD3T5U1_NEPGR|nr:hypothetical protein Nepgr_024954 [Nepenthes gracilis]
MPIHFRQKRSQPLPFPLVHFHFSPPPPPPQQRQIMASSLSHKICAPSLSSHRESGASTRLTERARPSPVQTAAPLAAGAGGETAVDAERLEPRVVLRDVYWVFEREVQREHYSSVED